MNRPPIRDQGGRSWRNRRPRPWRSFSLVELLVVMGIMAILLAIALPAMSSLLEGDSLNSAAQQVADQINLARQVSSAQNATVELRVFKLAGNTTGFTALELGTNTSAGVWTPAGHLSILPQNIIISPNTTLSSAFYAASTGTMGTGTSPISGATYYPFEFRPSGIVTPIMGMSTNCFTVLPARYSTASVLTGVKNYAIIQINPVTATTIIFRP